MSDTPDNQPPQPKLTAKQRAFVTAYVQCLNATEAAARAKYSGDRATLAQVGYENLRKPEIRAAVDEELRRAAISKEEVVARLSAQARGDMGDFLRVDEEDVTLTWSLIAAPVKKNDRGEVEIDVGGLAVSLALQDEVKPTDRVLYTATVKRAAARLDLLAAGEAGRLGLVKKYTVDKEGKVAIELYDAQAALIKLGEAHGIFRDRIADSMDAIAAAARSLDQKLMADLDPGATGGAAGEPDDGREGGATV